ncbi:MAG: NADH-quinone oxidoreductase subunit NuoB [Elusimicrobiota bacterium]
MSSIKQKILTWARIKSPWVIHFNTGACNACDIEIIAALTPRYDLERFGVVLKGTPKHADIILCSGPITRQIEDRLKNIYEQMPAPKFVVAVGTCACSGGVFQGCYSVKSGIDKAIPVAAYIPGCPASPKALIDGVVKLLSSLDDSGDNKAQKELNPVILGEHRE